MREENDPASSIQEKYLFETFPFIHRIIFRKLGRLHRDSIEDLKQKVFLRLWRWRLSGNRDLSEDEWQKMANVTARNEVSRFFGEKYTRDVLFSQMDESTREAVLSIESSQSKLQGNSNTEICSLMKLVWKAAQILSLRQKYAFFLQSSYFLTKFISCRCCSIKELADYFQATEEEIAGIINCLPLSDEKIGALLETKLNEKPVAPHKIWEARSKAKARLAKFVKEYTSNERSSDAGRT